MSNNLVILSGLQGAGKTSFYRKHLSESHVLISKDIMKNRKGKGVIQNRMIRKLLSEGKSVAVDNTNLSRGLRSELIHLGHEFNVPVILYYFPITVEESLQRNEGPGRKVIPIVGIYSSAKTFEEPTIDEGYDEAYKVTMLKHDWFEIDHLNRENLPSALNVIN